MAAVCGLDGRMRAGVQSAPALAGTAKFRRATEGCCRCTGASLFLFLRTEVIIQSRGIRVKMKMKIVLIYEGHIKAWRGYAATKTE